MTLPEFLEKLEQTPRDWRIDEVGCIRRFTLAGPQCPITSITGEHADCWFHAAGRIGLKSADVATEIVDAADGKGTKKATALRAKLLKACGLESA